MEQGRGVEGEGDVAVDDPEGLPIELFLEGTKRAAGAEDDGFVGERDAGAGFVLV